MTVAETIAIVARRVATHAVDRDTATQQIRVIVAQSRKPDAASAILDLALAMVAVEDRAAKLAKDLKCQTSTAS